MSLFSICHFVIITCFLFDRSTLPNSDSMLENDSYDAPDGQLIMSRLQWDGSSDISPSDSASSKASEFFKNNIFYPFSFSLIRRLILRHQ